jgi:TRAP-type uncharacterized transport system substrate-binding protein
MLKLTKKVSAIIATIIAVIVVFAVVAYITLIPPAPPAPKPLEKVSWTIGTSDPGTVGYVAYSAVASITNKLYPDYFEITVKTVGGAAAGIAVWDKGEVDLGYTAMNIINQYVTKTGRWAPEKATAMRYDEMTVIIYHYPLAYTMAVTEDLKDIVTSWSDVKKLGMTVGFYVGAAHYASHEAFREAFSILFDVKPTDLDGMLALDVSEASVAPDLLALGKVKVLLLWGDPGGPASWIPQAFSKVGYKMVIVPPSPDELEKILSKSKTLVKYTIDITPYGVKTRDGKTSFDTIALAFGLAGSKKLSKDHVSLFFEAHITHAKDFEATGIASFKNYANWFLSFNVESFKQHSKFGAKIHAGVAEVLKKYGYDPKALGILVAEDSGKSAKIELDTLQLAMFSYRGREIFFTA